MPHGPTESPRVESHHEIDRKAALMLVLITACWGLNQVGVKLANEGVSPIFQAALRSLGGAVLVWLWALWRRLPLIQRDGSLGYGLLIGAIFAVEFLLYYIGLTYTTAARGVLFFYTSPFVVALGAHVFLPQDRLTRTKVLGLLAAFAGLVLAFADEASLPTPEALIGDVLCFLAAILWGATTVIIKATPLAGIPAAKTLLYQLGLSALLLPLAAWAAGEPGVTHPTPLVLGAVAYQIVVVAFASYVAWYWLITRYPASRLAAFTFLGPVFGVLFGGVLLDEPVSTGLVLSLALIAAGIYLVNRPQAPSAGIAAP